MRWMKIGAIALLALAVLLVVVGRAGLFAGRAPKDLGVHDGRLKAPSSAPNSVSSQVDLWPGLVHRDLTRIAPLPLTADGPGTMGQIRRIVVTLPGAEVVTERPDYLYVRFRTRWLGFVDDAEFWFDPSTQVIQVRSASRVGRSDFGVNRGRIEEIRRQLAGGSGPR
jgi:uncharacterized protein (DUF1499 family)